MGHDFIPLNYHVVKNSYRPPRSNFTAWLVGGRGSYSPGAEPHQGYRGAGEGDGEQQEGFAPPNVRQRPNEGGAHERQQALQCTPIVMRTYQPHTKLVSPNVRSHAIIFHNKKLSSYIRIPGTRSTRFANSTSHPGLSISTNKKLLSKRDTANNCNLAYLHSLYKAVHEKLLRRKCLV